MGIICFSETYLDTSGSVDDDNLQIPGYSSVRADHPSNTKREGVLIYYKKFLPIKLIDVKYLHESLNFELRIGGKFCKFLSLYRSPSQSNFETFLENLELNIDHMAEKKQTFMMVVLGDFNAKSKSWYTNNDNTNFEGSKLTLKA